MIGLCTTQTQVQPKYVTALNDMDRILEFEEGTQRVDVKRSIEQMENWFVMPVQVQCMTPGPEQLKILHCANHYHDSTLTAPEAQEGTQSQIEGVSKHVDKSSFTW